MNWLIFGIALFVSVHLVSSVVPSSCAALKAAVGEKTYRGVYSVLVLLGLALFVYGWRNAVPIVVYAPPAFGPTLAFVLMFAAIFLFGASHARTNLRRYVRHPQLAAVMLWSAAHLLANGDIRSIVLFSSLGAWALIEIPLINRRDSEWKKPPRASLKSERITAAVSVVVFLVLVALHPYYTGVSPLPN